MKKIFEFLWSGCWHKWEWRAVAPLSQNGTLVGNRVTTCCPKCGKYRIQDLTD